MLVGYTVKNWNGDRLVIWIKVIKVLNICLIGAFFHQDKLGKCWQILQSESAIGSGGLIGVGPGNSYARWGYLPSPHSDMVGSIILLKNGN